MSLKEVLKSNPAIHRIGLSVKNGWKDLGAIGNYLAQRRLSKTGEGPIRVGFLCQFIPAWSKLKPVYEQMVDDDRFEPVLICVPSNMENSQLVGDTGSNDTYEYFLQQGYPCLNAREKGSWLDLAQLKLQYIFYPRPYNAFLPEQYSSKRVSRYCRICLVIYGMSMTEQIIDTVMERDFFRYVYLYFAESPYVMERNRKKGALLHGLGLQKSVYCGLPGMEEIAAQKNAVSPAWVFSRNTFRVIWTPRWTTDPNLGGTNFFVYYSLLLDYAQAHPEVDFLFRPHPLALDNFLRTGEMTEQEVRTFRERIRQLPNVSLDEQKEYFSTFWGATVLLTDISGIMPEFFTTGKPMIYCGSNMPLTPTPHTKRMLEGCYTVYTPQELIGCLEQLMAGEDPLAQKRQSIAEDLYGGLHSAPARGILAELVKDWDGR